MATERLSCKLTLAERELRARETTEMLAEVAKRAKTAKAEIEEVNSKLIEAARAAREGWEQREVEIEVRPNNADLTVETWRLDTGELVRVRVMSDEEKRRARQPRLLKD